MANKMINICIIGGGVNGLCCAIKIAEYYQTVSNILVTILTEQLSPHTTGDGSAGLWGPFLSGNTPIDRINQWSKESHDFFHDLWKSGHAVTAGITLQPVIRLTTSKQYQNGSHDFLPLWQNIVYGCTPLSDIELNRLRSEHSRDYTAGINFVTFTCEPIRFLPYLLKRLSVAGGKVINERRIKHFDELVNLYDIVINCSGLNSKWLCNDNSVHPIRGQVMRAHAPWQFHTVLDESDDGNYVIANIDSVVLGGTHQVDDYNISPTTSDRNFIHNGCCRMVPSLINEPLESEWVGLRPGRDSVRLEHEIYENGAGETLDVIHNYGHGGSGVTLAWGCATDVLDLTKQIVNKFFTKERRYNSKL